MTEIGSVAIDRIFSEDNPPVKGAVLLLSDTSPVVSPVVVELGSVVLVLMTPDCKCV
jgi:hypothetical protein